MSSRRLVRRDSSLPDVRKFSFAVYTPEEVESSLRSSVQFDMEKVLQVDYHEESPPAHILASPQSTPGLKRSRGKDSIRNSVMSWLGQDKEVLESLEEQQREQDAAALRKRDAALEASPRKSNVSTAVTTEMAESYLPLTLRFKLCKPLDKKFKGKRLQSVTFPKNTPVSKVLIQLTQTVFPGVAAPTEINLYLQTDVKRRSGEVYISSKKTLIDFNLQDDALVEVRARNRPGVGTPRILSGPSVKDVLSLCLEGETTTTKEASARRLGSKELGGMVQSAFDPSTLRKLHNEAARLHNIQLLPFCTGFVGRLACVADMDRGRVLMQIMNKDGITAAKAGIWHPQTIDQLVFPPDQVGKEDLVALCSHLLACGHAEGEGGLQDLSTRQLTAKLVDAYCHGQVCPC